ncbi:uncharacterized protein LOC143232363 isoform X2 [Tachypleus tridentatus]|uniref:uncharacterized protein LOC143232363 isoform X2 n=1 Tax=Tachypleus tridentatus TaxID=6853 RepID=UPI003FD00CCC
MKPSTIKLHEELANQIKSSARVHLESEVHQNGTDHNATLDNSVPDSGRPCPSIQEIFSNMKNFKEPPKQFCRMEKQHNGLTCDFHDDKREGATSSFKESSAPITAELSSEENDRFERSIYETKGRNKQIMDEAMEYIVPEIVPPQSDIKKEILAAIHDTTVDGEKKRSSFVASDKPREDTFRKRALSLTPKHKFLMPDLMETSETEIVKGSANVNQESESIDQQPAVEMAVLSAPGNNPIYPSFPDTFLKRLGLHGSSSFSNDQLSEQQIESKFSTLSLGFKTDKLTLSKRIELQQRQRDTAEKNVENETKALKEYLNALNQLSTTHEMRELISQIQQQVDVVHRSTCRVSSRAEIYGAVQQEERMNRAFEVMVMYVENLKRVYEKEHQELEETRRLLIENRLLPSNSSEVGNDESKMLRSLRSMSVGGVGKTASLRRASFSTLHHYLPSDRSRGSVISNSVESRGRLLSTVVSAVSSLGTTTGNPNLSSRLSTHLSSTPPKQFMSRRSSLPAATGPVFGLGRASITVSPLNGKGLHAEDIPEQELDYYPNGNEGNKYLLKNDSSSKLDQTIEEGRKENVFVMRTCSTDSAGKISAERKPEFESLARQISNEICEEEPLEFDSQSSLEDDGLTEQGSDNGDNGGNYGIHEHWAVRNRILDKSSIIRKIFWELREWDNTTLKSRLRLTLSVILVLAGVFSIVATLVPVQARTTRPQTSNRSFQNILRVFFGPYLSLTPL